jgi:hypothetical protein
MKKAADFLFKTQILNFKKTSFHQKNKIQMPKFVE